MAAQGLTEIVWVSGTDAVPFLNGLLSQNIAAIDVGRAAPSRLLASNGKLRATLLVLRGIDRVGLVCDAGRGEIVAADPARFRSESMSRSLLSRSESGMSGGATLWLPSLASPPPDSGLLTVRSVSRCYSGTRSWSA